MRVASNKIVKSIFIIRSYEQIGHRFEIARIGAGGFD